MQTTYRQLFAEDRLLRVFVIGRMLHPVGIELLSLAGEFDGFWLDQEHAGLSTEQISLAVTAGRAVGLPCFVRLATVHYSLVNQSLESGADGVMAARINSVAEAAEFVRWAKFTPYGHRGANAGGADGKFSHLSPTEFAEATNRDQMVAIQIETVGAVNDADKIAALDQVDMLFVGASDLSHELGIFGDMHHDKLWESIDRVATACRNHGKAWGAIAVDPLYSQRAVEKGCRLLTFGSDVVAMRAGLDALKKRFAEYFSV